MLNFTSFSNSPLAETMFEVGRNKPWAGLGQNIEEAPSSEVALKLAGLDWKVFQNPVLYNDEDTGYRLNIRDKDDKVLGVVGNKYRILQNEDAFSFMDDVIGGDVRYETAGSLKSGKRVWMLAKMEGQDILGEPYEPYMCISNTHDGSGSVKVFMTPIRVWCQNTLNVALQGAKRTWSARHSTNLESKVEEARETLQMANSYMLNFKKEAEELYQIKVAPAKFTELSEQLFPVLEDMESKEVESQILLRERLRNAWEEDDLGNIKGTAWAFVNAVSDMTTHKALKNTETARENAFMQVIDSPKVLDRSMQLVREIA